MHAQGGKKTFIKMKIPVGKDAVKIVKMTTGVLEFNIMELLRGLIPVWK